ncbi:hypothetical protein [Haloarchaeobius sp. TZWWS8]|uniref:hypothetical protein n=1 Tax=Haloarchaeobius sp. TZWWS8 TaxID=3446121 RepID=UPI003EBCA0B4
MMDELSVTRATGTYLSAAVLGVAVALVLGFAGGVVASPDLLPSAAQLDEPTPPGPDADGDLLPDEWERAGETPGGTLLPGADPHHKDLYVQFVYGSNVDTFSERELDELRRIWAEMPVANPDGETGIRLHVVPGRRLAEPVALGQVNASEVRERYTRDQMDSGFCTYYGVTVATMDTTEKVGYGDAPGYASVVHRDTPWYAHGGSGVMGVVTHELLHNVVGQVDGDAHTERGWLAAESDGPRDFLSTPTVTALNERGFAYPEAGHGYYLDLCDGVSR